MFLLTLQFVYLYIIPFQSLVFMLIKFNSSVEVFEYLSAYCQSCNYIIFSYVVFKTKATVCINFSILIAILIFIRAQINSVFLIFRASNHSCWFFNSFENTPDPTAKSGSKMLVPLRYYAMDTQTITHCSEINETDFLK